MTYAYNSRTWNLAQRSREVRRAAELKRLATLRAQREERLAKLRERTQKRWAGQ